MSGMNEHVLFLPLSDCTYIIYMYIDSCVFTPVPTESAMWEQHVPIQQVTAILFSLFKIKF